MNGQHTPGKKALVTGASKGVGRGIALALASDGYDVAVNYRSDQAGAEETAKRIADLGRETVVVAAHVGNAAEVTRMFGQVIQELGGLDVLVNNAALHSGVRFLSCPSRCGTIPLQPI